ncbi:hypothetical protein [Streptomyces sp. UNOB3_S3]|uniref:hypothetical protein n=1 Tax=Streptomyces sp. UNOB3_S3 TaxID=2871682 RepID=UPI001E3957D1|nr:hypothetical protein [Streptomyces sp. UNOB3_S3]
MKQDGSLRSSKEQPRCSEPRTPGLQMKRSPLSEPQEELLGLLRVIHGDLEPYDSRLHREFSAEVLTCEVRNFYLAVRAAEQPFVHADALKQVAFVTYRDLHLVDIPVHCGSKICGTSLLMKVETGW